MGKVYLNSLGCAKNLVDSERVLASLMDNFALEPTVEAAEADLLVLNTCAFLQSAVSEALEAIMDLGREKKPTAKLLVLGCLPSRYLGAEGSELAKGLPEVDMWLPNFNYSELEGRLSALGFSKRGEDFSAFGNDGQSLGRRQQATPFFRAFLKIAEGCNNHCTYCLIPRLRGPLKSYRPEVLLAEAVSLVAGGVKEITLVAQDLSAYGNDKNESLALLGLLRQLNELPHLEWIRLLYLYPENLTEDLVRSIAELHKVVPYLDLPLQHSSPQVLKKMGRPKTSSLALIKNLRKWWPSLALRSTLIVGFPGETEDDFQHLLDFVNEAALDHLGVFKFSAEPEVPASKLPNPVPQHIKEKRRRKIMATQRKISLANNKKRVGQVYPVLVEGLDSETGFVAVGRAPFQAPEVDGVIYFTKEQPEAGQIVRAKIVKATAYDLLGEIVS